MLGVFKTRSVKICIALTVIAKRETLYKNHKNNSNILLSSTMQGGRNFIAIQKI